MKIKQDVQINLHLICLIHWNLLCRISFCKLPPIMFFALVATVYVPLLNFQQVTWPFPCIREVTFPTLRQQGFGIPNCPCFGVSVICWHEICLLKGKTDDINESALNYVSFAIGKYYFWLLCENLFYSAVVKPVIKQQLEFVNMFSSKFASQFPHLSNTW